MKKWLLRIAAVFGLILIGLTIIILIGETDKTLITRYTDNKELPTIKNDWQGTPVDRKGRFVNVEHPFLPSTIDLLKWRFSTNPQAEEKEKDKTPLAVLDPKDFLDSEKDGILWLGHAGFFIRLNGVSILLDPIFGKPPFVKTFVDVPSPIDRIREVDYILISHDHRDHTDEETIKQITGKFPNAEILAGLGMEDILNDWKTASNKLQTSGWYQQFSLSREDLKIYFLPARHWSRRGLFDTNERLWGSFVIKSETKTIYFSGDSGYDNHYKQAGEIFPGIDYFLIGIGAYQPRWFMKPNHNNPEEALQAFADIKAKYLIPMHFGRFDLSDEPPGEPLRILREKAAQTNITEKIKALNINEHINLND